MTVYGGATISDTKPILFTPPVTAWAGDGQITVNGLITGHPANLCAAVDPERALPELDDSNHVALARQAMTAVHESSARMRECRAAIRVFVLCSWTAADPKRERPVLDGSNNVALALQAGLDAAIPDPLEESQISELFGAELVLGRDRFCRKYTTAFRANRIVA